MVEVRVTRYVERLHDELERLLCEQGEQKGSH